MMQPKESKKQEQRFFKTSITDKDSRCILSWSHEGPPSVLNVFLMFSYSFWVFTGYLDKWHKNINKICPSNGQQRIKGFLPMYQAQIQRQDRQTCHLSSPLGFKSFQWTDQKLCSFPWRPLELSNHKPSDKCSYHGSLLHPADEAILTLGGARWAGFGPYGLRPKFPTSPSPSKSFHALSLQRWNPSR